MAGREDLGERRVNGSSRRLNDRMELVVVAEIRQGGLELARQLG